MRRANILAGAFGARFHRGVSNDHTRSVWRKRDYPEAASHSHDRGSLARPSVSPTRSLPVFLDGRSTVGEPDALRFDRRRSLLGLIHRSVSPESEENSCQFSGQSHNRYVSTPAFLDLLGPPNHRFVWPVEVNGPGCFDQQTAK